MTDQVWLLIGTTKGAFILNGDTHRAQWALSGPHCDGWPINHVIGDPITGTLWAGGGNEWSGAGVWRSEDGGARWTLTKLAKGQSDEWFSDNPDVAEQFGWQPSPPAPFTGELDAIWSLGLVDGRVLCGGKPAALYQSSDRGASWERLPALSDHPSSESWQPGAAGLVLHTIISDPGDPNKLWVGISAAGVFATEDGGVSWERRNRLSNAESSCTHDHPHPAAGRDGNAGFCVHNMVRANVSDGDLLYQQNHHGVFRSRDGGRSWDDLTDGLPSTFGFPIRVHPRDSRTIWTLPLNGDSVGRYPPDAAAAVWRSRDAGETWEALRGGLPQENCFFTVLRQAMANDTRDPAGVYFGTNTGSIFATTDEGDTWSEIARHLPTVLSVEVLETT